MIESMDIGTNERSLILSNGAATMRWFKRVWRRLHIPRSSRRRRRQSGSAVDPLEARVLLTAPAMTDLEQYMLELVNRARANPNAEAARYGIGLNAGLPTGTISAAAKQPLAPQQQLIVAARLHSQDMLQRNYFDHVTLGSGVTSASAAIIERAQNQGYSQVLADPTKPFVGETIGWWPVSTTGSDTALIDTLHEELFKSTSHRPVTLNPVFEELGIGAKRGPFRAPGTATTLPSVEMVTQDFGNRNQDPYLTGVVYTDLNNNRFYTIGESIRGGTVTAVNLTTGVKYSDTIGVSGAYGFVVPPGKYAVTATVTLNGVSKTFKKSTNKVVGNDNVKVDFETNSDPLVPAPVRPVVDLNGSAPGVDANTSYTAGGGAVTIVDSNATVTDADSPNLQSATITLVSPAATESLSITGAPSTITVAAYNATSGILRLTGNASLAHYRTAIRLLKYTDSRVSATGNKTVKVIVNDGGLSSAPATITIQRIPAAVPGDMDGDGQITTQDGNLVTLILLGASDATLQQLRTPGSTATVAQIRASFERYKSRMDIDNNGTTTTQDGNLIVLVKLGASDSVLELLRGPANTPDTRNNAAQIRAAVQSLVAGPAAFTPDSSSALAEPLISAQGLPATVSVPLISVQSDLFNAKSNDEAVVSMQPETSRAAGSDLKRSEADLRPQAPLLVSGMMSSGSRREAVDEIDSFFASLRVDHQLQQAF
ncbi:MAG: hypothetical protein R3C17_01240 [Planctomycetaceae bacterium]